MSTFVYFFWKLNLEAEYRSITRAQVDRIKPPRSGLLFVRDVDQPGFGIKVTTSGTKSFFVESRIRGKNRTRRKVIGRYPAEADEGVREHAIVSAKSSALVYLSHFQQGNDPIGDGKAIAGDDYNPTLQRIFDDYVTTKSLKPRTVVDYNKVLKWGFSDWLNVHASEIDRDDVLKRHQTLGQRSHAQSNYALRLLRALFNFAIERYRDARGRPVITDNPVILLSRVKAWYRIPRRRTVIRRHELPAWIEAVRALEGERGSIAAPVVRDYLQFLLFTGMRRTEAATLRRKDIDLKDRTFVAPETKNWSDHALPMSEPVREILTRRLDESGPWVFPNISATGPIEDVRYWALKVQAASGVTFTPHDLRRTFTTVAESLDLSGYTLKRLLNHKINDSDVTSGYIVSDVERLRPPMDRIATRLQELFVAK